MSLAAGIGILVYVLVNLAAGVRLLWLARRTRQLPETYLGLAFVTAGAIGFALILVSNVTMEPHPEWHEPLLRPGITLVDAGIVLHALFVRSVFRPGVAWATVAFWAIVAGLLGPYVHDTILTGVSVTSPEHVSPWIAHAARILAYAWGAAEAFVYHRKLTRRLRLGLAEPVVTNRFFLWGLGSSGAAAITLTAVFLWMTGHSRDWTETLIALYAALGFLTSCANWLAFIPPASYLRWLAGSAQAQAKAA